MNVQRVASGLNLSKEIQTTTYFVFFSNNVLILGSYFVCFLHFYTIFLGPASFLLDSNAPVDEKEKEKGRSRRTFMFYSSSKDLSLSFSLLNNNSDDNASFQHVPTLPSLSHVFPARGKFWAT